MMHDEPQSVPQQQQQQQHNHHQQNMMNDQESSKLLHTPDDRLSPNLFLNLNFENANTLDTNVNSLKFEWSSFNPSLISSSSSTVVPSNLSLSPNNKNYVSSPTYEFLNVDQFNMDNFKNECILNLDHNLLNSVNDTSTSLISNTMPNRSIDLHGFSLGDDTKELLDLEKPININISDKY
jgi:hypothetical protein